LPALKQIRLAKVKVFERISDAPIGTLLQIAVGGTNAEVCLRAQLHTAESAYPGAVLLEGTRAGTFLTDEELNDRIALDLTGLAELVLSDPAPRTAAIHPNDAGSIYEVSARSGSSFLGMAVKLPISSKIIGYARLTPPLCGHIEQILERLYLGKALVADLARTPTHDDIFGER
jgi:hypothetical protein